MIDADLWQQHRELMWRFMQPALDLDGVNTRLDALARLFDSRDEMPLDMQRIYDSMLIQREALFREVKDAAKEIFDGPMKEQAERRQANEELGRRIATNGSQGQRGPMSFLVGQGGPQGDARNAVGRMFVTSGAVEPLDWLKAVKAPSDEELFDCIRKLAASVPAKPDAQRE
jgi:hypothetical protein